MAQTDKPLTETKVRNIAREEALKVNATMMKEMESLKQSVEDTKVILGRLERLLLGEVGINEEDTLKSRANFAYLYAKRNTESKIIEKAEPALDWFHDWDTPEKGCEESKLQTLGKMVNLYGNVKWLLGLLGITTVINAVPILIAIVEWISNLIN